MNMKGVSILAQLEKDVQSNPISKHAYDIENKIYNIVQNLVKIRKDKKISRRKLAKITGVSLSTIERAECYNGNPTLSSLVKYCDGIGIDLDKAISEYCEKYLDK